MITSILLAYDGSDSAAKAFEMALEIAGKFQARLSVLTIARPPEPAGDVELEAVLENAQAHFAAVIEGLKVRTAAAGLRARFEIRVGHPAEQIVSMAEAERADLVIIGHRGKSLFQRWITGSTSKQVVSYSPCPVLVVR
ncbi:MAG: universal stress protein [Acidobacteria bacterium]|nr:universal stress protein [Bacteroidota bacterium]MBS1766478.1 universal stress protein [Acidobacteriota bacterium]